MLWRVNGFKSKEMYKQQKTKHMWIKFLPGSAARLFLLLQLQSLRPLSERSISFDCTVLHSQQGTKRPGPPVLGNLLGTEDWLTGNFNSDSYGRMTIWRKVILDAVMRQTWDVLPRTTVNTVFIQTILLVCYVVARSNTIVLESTVLISIYTLPTLIGICALTFAVEFTREN